MILKYLISYEKSEIQIISLISLPWISQHVCTLLTCPIFRTMVSIKGRNLTAWVRSLSSASGNCQNWICHRAPLKTKYFHLSNQQLWLGQKKPFTRLISVAWHLPSIQTQFTASAYGIWEISQPETASRTVQFLRSDEFCVDLNEHVGNLFSVTNEEGLIFLTHVKICQCTK